MSSNLLDDYDAWCRRTTTTYTRPRMRVALDCGVWQDICPCCNRILTAHICVCGYEEDVYDPVNS